MLNKSNINIKSDFLKSFTRKSMKLIIIRTSLCALEIQKGRTYVPGMCNYGYAPLSQIPSYPGSRKL